MFDDLKRGIQGIIELPGLMNEAINGKDNKTEKASSYFKGTTQPNNINGVSLKKTGKTVGDTSLKGSKTNYGKSMDNYNIWTDGKNYYMYVDSIIDNGNNTSSRSGYYLNLGSANNNLDANLKSLGIEKGIDFKTFDKSQAKPTVYSYGKGLTTNYYSLNNKKVDANKVEDGTDDLKALIAGISKGYEQDIKDLKDSIKELANPRVLSADEIAAQYGLTDMYNYDNILAEYNKQTNEYRDAMNALYTGLRNENMVENARYLDSLNRDYRESYKDAAATTVGEGARAASLLASNILSSYDNNTAATMLNQNILANEQQRKAELANNPYEAKDEYNRIAKILSDASVNHNTSDISQRIGDWTALSTRYATTRQAQAQDAYNTATKYQGLANAQATRSASKSNQWNNLYDWYASTMGPVRAAQEIVSNVKNST